MTVADFGIADAVAENPVGSVKLWIDDKASSFINVPAFSSNLDTV